MIIIRFPDADMERKALGKLGGRFTFNPNSEVGLSGANGARPLGRFNVLHPCDSRTHKTRRPVKRRQRRAPANCASRSGRFVSEFGFKTWDNGETMVPKTALSYLATENIVFTVVGPADYERLVPLRNPAAVAV